MGEMAYEASCYEYQPERDSARIDFWVANMEHGWPPFTPAGVWNFCHANEIGAQWGAAKICLPSTKGFAPVMVNGCLYQTPLLVTDEEERKQREVVFRERIKPWIEDYDRLWGEIVSELKGYYDRLFPVDLEALSNIELVDHLEEVMHVVRRMWKLHFYSLYVNYLLYGLFEDMCRTLLGIDDTHPLFHKLIAGEQNELEKTDRMLWQLSRRVSELALADLFMTTPDAKVVSKLEGTNAGRQWLREFGDFLNKRGWRMPRAMEIASKPWAEDPTMPITHVKQFLSRGEDFDFDEERQRVLQESKRASEDVLSRIPEGQRDWFRTLMSLAKKASAFGPNHTFWMDHPGSCLLRKAYIECGKRLAKAGAIDDSKDAVYLIPDEILATVIVPERFDYHAIVERRKELREKSLKMEHPPIFGKIGFAEAAPLVAQDVILSKTAIGSVPVAKPKLKADLYGVCGAPGIAEGTARVVFSLEEISKVQPGDILVTISTNASWTPVFSIIRGAVIDRGGSLCHAAIVGREIGIPVVINTFEGTKKIKTGQKIRVNADLGVVHILR
jgi:pyruvate,water dikinase